VGKVNSEKSLVIGRMSFVDIFKQGVLANTKD
jgi:hypothetical protein